MKYSKLGYKRYSPDLYNKYNVIPSGRITMQDVDFPVFGMDDMGNTQMMYPGGEYQFPGNQVFELPMAQNGKSVGSALSEYKERPYENLVEVFDFSGLSSWDDAKRAYDSWQESGQSFPSFEQGLDMFGAVPALGKFGKLRYLADSAAGVMKPLYKYIPWQQILNTFDGAQDELEKQSEKKQIGGQTSLSLGYDSMYGSPTAAFRYMMNPQDDSKYYGEVFGTKQGPGIAAGLDYDNQKYGTQGMIRLGVDPLRGASIRAQGGKRFTPIDTRREELSWGPYGGINWQTNDYTEFDGTGNQLAYNNIRPRLTAGLNAQYEKELDNRGRLSIEGDLGVGIGNKYGDMGQFQPEPYAAINATYSFPRYKNTRTERPQPTTYSSGYKQGGGEQLQMRKGNTFDDYIVNPTIKAMAAAGDYLGPIVNQALDDVSSAAMNAMYTSPTLAPLAIKAQGAARPWLFQNIRPVEYPGIVSSAVNLTKGVLGLNAPPSRDPDGRYSIGEEAWQRALGNPTQSHYIIPSKYKPSKAKDADAQYYTLNRDVIDPQLLIAEAKKRDIQEGQSIVLPSLAPYIREGFMPREEFSQIDPLQNFTIGRGKDEKGNYISIYDRYDFEGPLNTLTNPYEFYDRYYYKGGGQHGGLDRWFAEKWVDVKTGKECGRQSGEKRKGYPACRPSKRVNSKTPKTASELSSTEKAKFKREKTSSQRISYQHKRLEYGGSIPRFRSDLY